MDNKVVPLGHVSGVHGVKGWVKIHSLTEPREAIFEYQPWLLGESLKEVRFSQGKKHGSRLIALFEDTSTRESAEELVHQPIAVYRDQFPETEAGEFYWTDLVGLGRMVLSYWEMPADTLAGRPMATKRICRTFSDCTTGPRNGLISGCYPLDPHYKATPEAQELKQIKAAARKCVADLAPNGTGLMLAPSHRMMSDISMANIEALMEAMEELA